MNYFVSKNLPSVQFTLDLIAGAQATAENSCDEAQLPDTLPAGVRTGGFYSCTALYLFYNLI